MKTIEITPALLRQIIDADTTTGRLTWRPRDASLFSECVGGRGSRVMSPEQQAKAYNTRFAGTPALNRLDESGYLGGNVFRRAMKAHRVLWAIHHGEFPPSFLDHRNGVRSDNRLCNLRAATPHQNVMNTRSSKGSSSKFLGVSWHKAAQKWVATITNNRKQEYLGLFDDEVMAALAYNDAALRIFKDYANLNQV